MALNLLLRVLYRTADKAVLDGLAILPADPLHHRGDALGAKKTH